MIWAIFCVFRVCLTKIENSNNVLKTDVVITWKWNFQFVFLYLQSFGDKALKNCHQARTWMSIGTTYIHFKEIDEGLGIENHKVGQRIPGRQALRLKKKRKIDKLRQIGPNLGFLPKKNFPFLTIPKFLNFP